jgi:hypothetical protein
MKKFSAYLCIMLCLALFISASVTKLSAQIARYSILAVTVVDWDAAYYNGTVYLQFTTTSEKDISHFIIERSFDGYNFSDLVMLVASGNSDIKRYYAFSDLLPASNHGIICYRLKAIQIDGSERVTDVKTIRTFKAKITAGIATYPNPVVSELRVTVPDNWQGKALTYQVINANGQLVQSLNVPTANKIQSINLQQVPDGVYAIKVWNGMEASVQSIVKYK